MAIQQRRLFFAASVRLVEHGLDAFWVEGLSQFIDETRCGELVADLAVTQSLACFEAGST